MQRGYRRIARLLRFTRSCPLIAGEPAPFWPALPGPMQNSRKVAAVHVLAQTMSRLPTGVGIKAASHTVGRGSMMQVLVPLVKK